MSFRFSIIIICRNAAHSIPQTIASVQSLSDDIVVYDSGSTDGTEEILNLLPVRLHSGYWEGFGKTREKAVGLARNNWVMILDSDEVVTEELIGELKNLNPADEMQAYAIRLDNHLGSHKLSWGVWGNDYRVRLYNKKNIEWNEDLVHEKLIIPGSVSIRKLKEPILHYTAQTAGELKKKMKGYALLTAEQYFSKGKRLSLIRRLAGPTFSFVKSYILKLGFLDGRNGYRVAIILAEYTSLKYRHLNRLWETANSENFILPDKKREGIQIKKIAMKVNEFSGK